MSRPLRHTPFDVNGRAQPKAAAHPTPDELCDAAKHLSTDDLVAFVRALVQERTPAAFASSPLLWESVRKWLAARHAVHPREVGMSGSAQLGYSIVATKDWAKFDPVGSDLDLFVVSGPLFEKIEREARRLAASPAGAGRYVEQVKTITRTLSRGWIDVKHVPADHDQYSASANLMNDASIIIDRLENHGYKLKPSSFRVYADWFALGCWTRDSYSQLSRR